MEILRLLQSTMVRRCHTLMHHTPYSLGDHISRMLMIADFLYDGEPPLQLIRGILYHDAAEGTLGDVPAPAKKREPLADAFKAAEKAVNKELGVNIELSSDLQAELKVIDSLEFIYFCRLEFRMGNKTILPNLTLGIEYLEAHKKDLTNKKFKENLDKLARYLALYMHANMG